jgi:hypothetical protein
MSAPIVLINVLRYPILSYHENCREGLGRSQKGSFFQRLILDFRSQLAYNSRIDTCLFLMTKAVSPPHIIRNPSPGSGSSRCRVGTRLFITRRNFENGYKRQIRRLGPQTHGRGPQRPPRRGVFKLGGECRGATRLGSVVDKSPAPGTSNQALGAGSPRHYASASNRGQTNQLVR